MPEVLMEAEPQTVDDRILALEQEIEALTVSTQEREKVIAQGYQQMEQMLEEVEQQRNKLKTGSEALAGAHGFLDRILNTMDELLIVLDTQGLVERVNQRLSTITGYRADELLGQDSAELFVAAELEQAGTDQGLEIHGHRSLVYQVFSALKVPLDGHIVNRDGAALPHLFRSATLYSRKGKKEGIVIVGTDVRDLKRTQAELMNASRLAGMATVATDVLHNVGNVLNSVNVTTELIRQSISNSEVTDLNRALAMMEERRGDLATFFCSDEKGKHVFDYLLAAGTTLANERDQLTNAIAGLVQNIEHIKNIVSLQQSYARPADVTQTVSIAKLLDDTIALHVGSFHQYDIQVTKEYEPVPEVALDQHKLLQVLVNLLKNAREALVEESCPDRTLRVRLDRCNNDHVRIQISDNGCGIPPQQLPRIFAYGFTTKANGHGFGLHSCANLVTEMHGTISAHSDGLRKGARFTVELPVHGKVMP